MSPMHLLSLKLQCLTVKEEMHLQENTLYDLDLGPSSYKMLPSILHILWPTYLQNLKLLRLSLGKAALTRNDIIWTWHRVQDRVKCCPVPSISCDIYSCKVWRCYVEGLRRRCIYRKIHYLTLTLGSRSQKMFCSTLYIMWPLHL